MAKNVMTKEKILKAIATAAATEVTKSDIKSLKDLKKQAKIFLQEWEFLKQQKELKTLTNKEIMLSILSHFKSDPNIDPDKINEMINAKENQLEQSKLDKAFYLLAFRFNDYLDIYRNKTNQRVGLFVKETYDDGKGEYTLSSYEIPLKILAMSATTGGKITILNEKGKFSNNPINNKYFNSNNVIEEKKIIDPAHILEAKYAYNGVRNRLQKYFDKAGKTGNNAKGGYLLWKISNEWKMAQIANYGSLSEGYFAFLMSQHIKNLETACFMNMGNSPYYSHEFIGSFYENYLKNVTNLSAIIEEDVVYGNKEYAVKKEKADLPGVKQYIEVAKYILSLPNDAKVSSDILEERIKQITFELSKQGKETLLNPEKTLDKIEEEIVKDYIKEVQEELNKKIKT